MVEIADILFYFSHWMKGKYLFVVGWEWVCRGFEGL